MKPKQRVLVVIPNDFRDEARARFALAQESDAVEFTKTIKNLGHTAFLLERDLVEPASTYTIVKKAIEEFRPTQVVERCYLWADPPIGQAIRLAVYPWLPLGVSAYIAPEGARLGEAPGEVFQLHTTCANRMTGRDSVRLFGPLTGDGSEQTMNDIREFLEKGKIVSGTDFKDFPLPIGDKHTQRAIEILSSMEGKIVAMTGQPSMGMLPCNVNVPWHCGGGEKGKGGWGLNIPIKSPDLYFWIARFQEQKERYLDIGRAYLRWLERKGVRFCYQCDFDGTPLSPEDIGAFTPETAAFQMALYAVMLEIAGEMNIDILGIPAQLVMTDHVVCGDLIKGIATSSEGPEGRSKPLRWETEGDIDGGISEEVLYQTTGHAPGFADIRCYIPWLDAWMMCNSGQCCADLAEKGFASCYSVAQYAGYFRSAMRGGTFAFLNPKKCRVVGLRVAIDQQGIYGTVAIGETVQSDDPRAIVDGRWPQLKVKVYDDVRKTRFWWPTNHYHWAESKNPIEDACVLSEVVRLAAGGDASRVKLLYDGRSI